MNANFIMVKPQTRPEANPNAVINLQKIKNLNDDSSTKKFCKNIPIAEISKPNLMLFAKPIFLDK